MSGQYVYTLFFTKHFGLSYYQVLDTPPGIGNIVRYASSAVGYVRCGFQYRYIQVRPGSFGPAGGAHSGCISADDDKLHGDSFVVDKGLRLLAH